MSTLGNEQSQVEACMDTAPVALEVTDLRVAYRTMIGPVEAVRGVGFSVARGETLCIVGESGCGKSATTLAAASLLPPNGHIVGGSVKIAGQETVGLSEDQLRHIRGRSVGMVFQESLAALNPLMTIRRQVAESLRLHRGLTGKAVVAEAVRLLTEVGIGNAEHRLKQYPHELSGGLRQRVAIAIALAANPQVLIADEPTTALDVTVQAQILEVLKREQQLRSMALVLVTHDLGVVAGIADRVAVMYAGQIVECGPVADIFTRPQHPYTSGLLQSRPRMHDDPDRDLAAISGQPPPLANLPVGCAFAQRCQIATDQCRELEPVLQPVDTAVTTVACWHPGGVS